MEQQDRTSYIRKLLNNALTPTELIIEDDSHLHVGHPGAKSGGGHYTIIIAAEIFRDKSAVECHRLVYAALGDAMGKEIHALRIKIKK